MQQLAFRYPRSVKTWLFIGLVMVCFQIVLGGITRLTGSGLSITKWEIVTGTMPPMNAEEWESEFDLYKATPQYQKINEGMSMSQFKFIYFWEYIHRLWARAMGFVFLFPFVYFLARKMIDRELVKRLGIVVGLAAVVASFGWIMVASGLNDRPWVNAYKLTIHLNLAILLFGFLLWTYFYARDPDRTRAVNVGSKRFILILMSLLAVQLVLGGVMSGMKAGLYYPTWPDMNGQIVPASIFQAHQWSVQSFVEYDVYALAPALTQFLHRFVAYILFALGAVFVYRILRSDLATHYKVAVYTFGVSLLAQVILGILTVINCIGEIPLLLGVLHQLGAILVLSSLLYVSWCSKVE